MTETSKTPPLGAAPAVAPLEPSFAAMGGPVASVAAMIKTIQAVPVDKPAAVAPMIALMGGVTAEGGSLLTTFYGQQSKKLLAPVIKIVGDVVQEWPGTLTTILAAPKATIAAADTVSKLGQGASTAADLGDALSAFATTTLADLKAEFATAKTTFATFNDATVQLNLAGQKLIYDLAQLEIHLVTQSIHQREAVLSAEGKSAAGDPELAAFNAKLALLQKTPVPTKHGPDYVYANGVVKASSEAYGALTTLGRNLSQTSNSLSDLQTLTSSDLAVMKSFLTAFQSDFAAAVVEAQKMTA